MSEVITSNTNINSKSNSFEKLETETTQIVSNCRSLICYTSPLKEESSCDKNNGSTISTIPESKSTLALEKITNEMTHILDALQNNLRMFELKQDSYSDVVPEIEKMFQKCVSKMDSNVPTKPTNHNNSLKNNQKKHVEAATTNNNAKTNPKTNNCKNSNKGVTNKDQVNNRQIVTVNRSSVTNKKKAIVNHPDLLVKSIVRPPNIPRQMYDPLGIIREEVQYAVRYKKTFTVRRGFQTVRTALQKRGWIEKIHPSLRGRISDELKKFYNHNMAELIELLKHKDIADVCKKIIKSKLLDNNQVDLYWSSNYEPYKECSDKVKLTKINKLRRSERSFTSKLGLSDAARKSFVVSNTSLAKLNHPRTYNLAPNGDTKGFIRDFNLTAAMSLLKWIKTNNETRQCKIISPSGKISISFFDFAVTECYKLIKKSENVGTNDDSLADASDHEWSDFLDQFYKTVHIGNHFKQVDNITELDLVRKATFILDKLQNIWPFLNMDGLMNIWILKPVNSSQGVGIHMCRTLNYILNVVRNNPNRRYIIQKYIERPLLIYNTKFDIRQWFLISSTVPLSIWFYKQCYVRFSSQTYNLRKLHESIHLTNNSVQCRYNNRVASRDITLPSYNMWDSAQFKSYLSDIGFPNVYNDIVYPGMKEGIIAAVLLHERTLDRRRNSFELFGADFILTEDFKPWLLEINANPALHASTPITAKMCPQVLEDVIKVVVDHENNKKASTGSFELIYRALPIQTTDRPVSSNQIVTSTVSNPKSSSTLGTKYTQPAPAVMIKNIGFGMRQTLEDLLAVLKNSKEKKKNNIKQSIATIASFTNQKVNRSIETVTSRVCIETQTLSKIKIIEIDSNNDLISSYHIKENKKMRNGGTNTVKYTKDDVLEILKNKVEAINNSNVLY